MKLDLRIGGTTYVAITASPGAFTQDKPWTSVRVIADVDACFAMLGDAGSHDCLVKAGTAQVFHLDPDEVLSYVKAAGAADGHIWLTACD